VRALNFFTRLLALVLLCSIAASSADSTSNAAPRVDRILILKSERTMHLMAEKQVIKT
jgi:hypothetical protein